MLKPIWNGSREIRMRYDIMVDHLAGICIWKSRSHYGVRHEDLEMSGDLRRQIGSWIRRHIDLRERVQDDPETYAAWLDYDQEGRRIAWRLKPALGPDAEVYYFCKATVEYERMG